MHFGKGNVIPLVFSHSFRPTHRERERERETNTHYILMGVLAHPIRRLPARAPIVKPCVLNASLFPFLLPFGLP